MTKIAHIQLGLVNLHFEMKRNAWKKIFFGGFRQLKVSAIALMAEVTLPEVRWETTLYEPVFQKLVNESLGIFLSLQKLAEEEAGVVSLSTGEKNNIEKHEISNALL